MTHSEHWQPDRGTEREPGVRPPLLAALQRGFACRCPTCGKAALFAGYLRLRSVCPVCATPLGTIRADDAPPYFTILVVGHIVVPAMLILERTVRPPLWVHAAIWVPLTLALTLALLRPIKGATVGAMLALGVRSGVEDH